MKEKVSEFHLEVGSGVWDAIEEQIDNRSVKKRGTTLLWWVFSGLSLVSFGWIAVMTIFYREGSVSDVPLATEEKLMIVTTSTQAQKQKDNFLLKTQINNKRVKVDQTVSDDESNVSYRTELESLNKEETSRELISTSLFNNESTDINDSKSFAIPEEKLFASYEDSMVQDFETTHSNHAKGLAESRTEEDSQKWSIILYGGPGVSYRTLKGQNAQGIVDHRNSHEKTSLSYDAGISGQLNIKNAAYIRFGLHYSRYSERYDFHHGTISHTTKNTYDYGQLNINYGKRLVNFGRAGLYAFGGFGVGRLLHAQSSWVDPNALVPVIHSNTQTNQPFEDWIFNFRFGADYQLPIGKRIEFHVIPSMEGLLNSSYKKETQLTQYPYAFNLNVGVLYHF